MNIRQIQTEQGWTDATLLDLLITYIENQQSPEAISDYLQEHAAPDDIPAHLEALLNDTDTSLEDWESMEGPETGVGVEYWYRHQDGREAYIVDDQGHITYEVSSPEIRP